MKRILPAALCLAVLCSISHSARGEAMLEWFNTKWNAMAQKMPEIAEAGYDSIWIPPCTKASGGLSVGYDCFDAFDLGSKDQEGTVSTFYGTQADLLNMINVAHRFGIRVYLDNVVNHRAFQVPGYDANTPTTLYPGFVPQDFHLLTISGGFYRNTFNVADFNNAYDVVYESLEGLIDIANEPGTVNLNFGPSVGSTTNKVSFVRQPNNPEFYCYLPNGTYVGFGTGNGITAQFIGQNPNSYSEYVQDFQSRSVRWELDTTKCDGFRLDAVKSVRDDFFGAEYGSDMNSSTYGYCGQIQLQYDLTHGFTNSNLRASCFDSEIPRTNALIFGEHLGAPPAQPPYINAGMRLLDNVLEGSMNGNFSFGPLNGFDSAGGNGMPGGPNVSIAYVQSADYGYAVKQALQYAFVLARQGLPVLYTDGFNYAPVLQSSGKAFPANSYNDYLGQFSDPKLPSMLYVHNQFARGNQIAKWSDGSVVAFERQDKRDNTSMSDADGTVLLFMLNGNGSSGQGRNIFTTFPAGAYLWQYARGNTDAGDAMTGFYFTVPSNQEVNTITIPRDGYFAFSWRSPEQSNLWKNGGGSPITILQNGAPTSTITVMRKDGSNGDPSFNPYGVSGAVNGSYTYPWTIPCITSGTNLRFIARMDGSTENMLIKLDGGVDCNSQMSLGSQSGGKRDNPPGAATDEYLGYEQMQFLDRQYPEKFAAEDTTRCQIGSNAAETFITTVGSETFTVINGPAGANSNFDTQGGTVSSFTYHHPGSTTLVDNDPDGTTPPQFSDSGSSAVFWAKTNNVGGGFKVDVYYTTDGTTPQGCGGVGVGTTKAAALSYHHNATDGGNWWTGSISPKPSGQLIYKIGAFRDMDGANPTASVFPGGASQVAQKVNMLTKFQITNFNADTTPVYPNNDFGVLQTGISQGFHVLRLRSFLNRSGRASIYDTQTQTFYYDTQLPQGEIDFPAADGTAITSQQYGAVVRTDQTVSEVDYEILDSDPTNDDTALGVANGNGSWVKANQFTANPGVNSQYPNEWHFNYVNVPSSGTAQILVRLKKITSATDNTLSDAAGHYTTLTRNVTTGAPAVQMFVAFPQTDNQVVGANYVMKTWFSKTLASGVSNQTLLSRFSVAIASSASGSSENPVTQPANTLSLSGFNVGNNGQYDELAFPIPLLYNGDPTFVFTIIVTYNNPGTPILTTTRQVLAQPVASVPDNILTPPELDGNGNPYQIILPQVPNPTAAQRSTPIVVQTDLNAQSVAINFISGPAVSPSDVVLTGTTNTGNGLSWNFTWGNVAQGAYTFTSSVTEGGNVAAVAQRDATVVYQLQDSDGDGIPDYWMQQYFGHTTGQDADQSQAGDNPTGDGMTNLEKYILGLSPLTHYNTNYMEITVGHNASGQPTLQFPTVQNVFYRIFYASDLEGIWTQAGGAITGSGSPVSWTDDGSQTGGSPSGASARYYHVQIGLQ